MYQQLETAQAFPSEQNDGMLTAFYSLSSATQNIAVLKHITPKAYYNGYFSSQLFENRFFSRTRTIGGWGALSFVQEQTHKMCNRNSPKQKRKKRSLGP